MPASATPTPKRNTSADASPLLHSANSAFKVAPSTPQTANTLLADTRSASPVVADSKVPTIKPACTAFVSQPIPDALRCQAICRSRIAPFALNHNDVPSNCAIAITSTARLARAMSCAASPDFVASASSLFCIVAPLRRD
ncbi:hypothetical protein OKW30_005520 [Paraburkholderia sp. Clong3]